MKNYPTQNQLSGRAIGSMIFAGFGAAWIISGLFAKQNLHPITIGSVVAVLALLVLASLKLMHEAKRFKKVPDDPRLNRSFMRVNTYQWVAISVVAFGFARLHIDAYTVSAITAIVGLHLFPLANLFNYRMHYATAIALVTWAGAGLVVLPVDQLQGTTALGTGLILWVSSAIGLFLASQIVRRAKSAPVGSISPLLGTTYLA